jgi:hypothetical protein
VTTEEELSVLEQQLRRLKIEYEMYFNNPAKRPPTDVEWKVLAILRKFSDGGRMNFAQRFRYNALAQQYAVQSDLWRKKSRIREEGYRRPQDALLSVQGVRIFEDKDKDKAEPESTLHAVTPLDIGDEETGTLEAAAEAAAASLNSMKLDTPAAPWPVAAKTAAAKPAPKPAAAAQHVPKPAVKAAAKQPYSAQLTDVVKDSKRVESLYKALVEAKKNAGEKLGDASNFDSFSSFVKKKTDQIRKQYACETVEYSVELEAGKVRLKAKAGSKA